MPEDINKDNFRESFEDSQPIMPETNNGQDQVESEDLEKEKALIERQLEGYPAQGKTAPVVKDDEDKVKVLKEAEKVRDIKVEGRKIEHLVSLAQKNSVAFAIEVAKKTDDSCLLDLFHDELVKQKLKP
ncbi:MAG: hypothetical protein NTZ42_02990 [Candidatus Gribaldobacteria bacterium]|nr:hypothetical protein [Candidatus Gribaldobacteria bacterium]